MGTRYQAVVDLTGANALHPSEARLIPNPIKRVPDVITAEHVSGPVRVVIPDPTIQAESIIALNPSTMTKLECKLYTEYWHSIPR